MRPHIPLAAVLITLLGLSACSPSDERPTGAAERTQSADCEPPTDAPPDEGAQTLSFRDQERAYLLALPDDYDGTSAHPLVLQFHGFGGTKEDYEELTGLAEQGTARGYVVVTPDALGDPPEWNMFGEEGRADDYGFVDALVTELTQRLCIDPARTYAAGLSAGSAFTGFLACKEPYRFAAAAMVAAFIPTTCPVDQAAPAVVAFHGTADPLVPYEGGQVSDGPVTIPPALDTFTQYADAYSCEEPVVEDGPAPGVERRRLLGCAGDSEVVLYTIVDGGHAWPGGVGPGGSAEADPDEPFSATDTILDFFDDHTKPARQDTLRRPA